MRQPVIHQTEKTIVILGAGPAGLTAAFKLSQAGKKVTVLEATPHIGGLSRSLNLWGQTVDLGPHRFFSKDDKINELWLAASRGEHQIVPRQTRIFYQNKFFQYPLEARNALKNLGILEAFRCIASYLAAKIVPKEEANNFEAWVTKRFGARLFQTFFKTYSEKLWGIPCTELHSDFAAQRIKKLSLWEAAKTALLGNSKKHQSLVDEFLYPNNGTGRIYENLVEEIRRMGGEVKTACPAIGFQMNGTKITGVKTPEGMLECEELISSIPLTTLAEKTCPTEPIKTACRNLKYRNTVLVYLLCNCRKNPFTDNWIYVHSSNLRVGRITNFNNWGGTLNPAKLPETILCLEYWTNDTESDWQTWTDDQWGELAIKEMEETGLIRKGEAVQAHTIKIDRSYPVYKFDYKEHVQILIDQLKQFTNLQVIGRYGAFKYNNQDHSILMGLLAAENLLGKKHNLWDVNTDYEVYQEEKG